MTARVAIETTEKKQSKRKGRAANLKPWKPGQSGNPAGRPKGARHKLCTQYIEDLQKVWDDQGIAAIRKLAKEKPAAFVAAVGQLVPREFDLGENTAAKVDWAAVWRQFAGAPQ